MKKIYRWPEDQCERVNRQEMTALRWCVAAINNVAYAKDDLQKRLDCIPGARVRWAMMLGSFQRLMDELLGTIPIKQHLAIQNVTTDMELRMVPKFTPPPNRACVQLEDLSFLIRAAQKNDAWCMSCTLNGEECRQCKLYQILESLTPQQEWGDSTICPYNREDWFER